MNEEIIPQELINEMLIQIGKLVQNKAKDMCPADTGKLRDSINYRLEGDDTVIIYSDDENAEAMEFGKPAEPLFGDEAFKILGWSERHQANVWGILNYLEKYGIEVGTVKTPLHITSYGRDSYRPFLRPAAHQSIPEMEEIITNVIQFGGTA